MSHVVLFSESPELLIEAKLAKVPQTPILLRSSSAFKVR